jgi:hypothetical protein
MGFGAIRFPGARSNSAEACPNTDNVDKRACPEMFQGSQQDVPEGSGPTEGYNRIIGPEGGPGFSAG